MPDALRVVVRADGAPTIGLGHVMRSFTLARALDDIGCEVTFRGSGLTEHLRAAAGTVTLVELDAPDGSGADALATARLGPHLVVVDGYHFHARYFAELEHRRVPYAVIDDNAETNARRPVAIVNQNPHATATMYEHLHGNPELLLGLDYALVRREIVDAAAMNFDRVPGTVFVAMGGSDPARLTIPIVTALAGEGRETWVACGPAMVDRDAVIAAIAPLSGVTVIDQEDYVSCLARCEVAVLAAGSSLWEAVTLRTKVIGIVVAENQRLLAERGLVLGHVVVIVDATARVTQGSLAEQLSAGLQRSAHALGPDITGAGGAALVAARLSTLGASHA